MTMNVRSNKTLVVNIVNVLKRIAFIIAIISILAGMSSCGRKKRHEAEFMLLFDTISQIVAYSGTKDEFASHAQKIYDELKAYHELYDIYNDYPGINNIKAINDNAGIKPVKVDKKIIGLLLFSKEWYEKTGGKVNIALGPVLKIWHDYRTEGINDPENAELPPEELLAEAARHTDINKVIIDKENSTVFLEEPGMRIDVGAIAKGYAVEQVAHMAIEDGLSSALLSIGGNVRAIGDKGFDNQLWNVGIQNPDKYSSEKHIQVVYMADMSLVSSGNYERYYTVNDKNYHHIIDPETLYPAEYYNMVTIICRDSGVADALSTALFNMPFEDGNELIESLPETEALWVMNNGEVKYSTGFEAYLKKK